VKTTKRRLMELAGLTHESVEDYRDPTNLGTPEYVKLVKQIKSRYSKMFDINIKDSYVVIVTDNGAEISVVDKSSIKKISAELESDKLPRGYVKSKDYTYSEINKIFKIIDMWLKRYTWLK
jgi:hypothetical protein